MSGHSPASRSPCRAAGSTTGASGSPGGLHRTGRSCGAVQMLAALAAPGHVLAVRAVDHPLVAAVRVGAPHAEVAAERPATPGVVQQRGTAAADVHLGRAGAHDVLEPERSLKGGDL